MHIICSSPAKTMHFRALVAVILRVLCKFTYCLQVTCKQCSYLYAVRSCPANRTHICKLCAVVLQVSCVFVHYLQFTCKYYAFFVFFAVVLQTMCNRWRTCFFMRTRRHAMVSLHAALLLLCPKGWEMVLLRFSCSWRLGWGLKAILLVPLVLGLSHASHSVANKP